MSDEENAAAVMTVRMAQGVLHRDAIGPEQAKEVIRYFRTCGFDLVRLEGTKRDGLGPTGGTVPEPIPMRLTCPTCGVFHVDVGEFATKPHHTHACQECGNVWRPAVVATVGVRFLPGFKNEDPNDCPVLLGRMVRS